jgi:hypothetical protein
MSKNVALALPELVAAIVFDTVVPDWECKSGSFIFNMQETIANIFRNFCAVDGNQLINNWLRLKKF